MEELDGNDSGSLPNISGSESGSESGSDDGSGREDYAMGALSDDDASGSGEEAEDVGDSGGEGESSGAEWASLDTLDAGLDHPESDPGWLPDDSGGEDLQGATSERVAITLPCLVPQAARGDTPGPGWLNAAAWKQRAPAFLWRAFVQAAHTPGGCLPRALCPAPPGLPLLDRSAAAQHGYLGATEELAGGYGWLDEGQVVALPLLVLFGECTRRGAHRHRGVHRPGAGLNNMNSRHCCGS